MSAESHRLLGYGVYTGTVSYDNDGVCLRSAFKHTYAKWQGSARLIHVGSLQTGMEELDMNYFGLPQMV
ncbi:hypothetical protein N7486_008888 [Penicillium sp. IBT 16267x]|nr:hypothetical protein N7486_008888 [Penicillium sp. IBT 16267x]